MVEDDNQVWDCMTEEWAEYMYGEGNKQPSIVKSPLGKKMGRESVSWVMLVEWTGSESEQLKAFVRPEKPSPCLAHAQ